MWSSRKLLVTVILLLLMANLSGCISTITLHPQPEAPVVVSNPLRVEEGLSYSSKAEVAFYLHSFGVLPPNFLTKKKAEEQGWVASKGNLWDVVDGMSIGGDRFGNRERRLPEKDGRMYYECDIAFAGGFRGAERLVYSNDGLVYYTADHYETFVLLYGDPNK